MYQPKNILVTGGAGFIGSNFLLNLMANQSDVEVINLDCLTYASDINNLVSLQALSNYHFVHGSINDKNLLADIFQQYRIDTVIHFAAESHVDRSISNPDSFIQTNIVGSFNLLEQARTFWFEQQKLSLQQCRFIHVSTDEVYGSLDAQAPAFKETNPYLPNSPYSASKAAADHLARSYFHTYRLPVITTNCSNNYGPFQHQEKFIPTIIHACINQQPIPIYGDGSNIRDWIYVLDHCDGINTVLQHGRLGESYNIGSENEQTNLSIAKTICGIFDEKFPQQRAHASLIQFVTDRPGHDWRYAIDSSKMREEFSWQAQTAFDAGLASTIDYYLTKNSNLLG